MNTIETDHDLLSRRNGAAALTSRHGAQVLAAIRARRSNPNFLPDPPTRAEIELLLEAANMAPNHGLTQPWRFCVVRGGARHRLGEATGRDAIAQTPPPDPAAEAAMREAAMQKMLRAPVILVVAAVEPSPPRFPFWEELTATGAAVQNLLLAAEAIGLAGFWRSNTTELTETKRLLGLPAEAQVVAFVNLGRPDPAGALPSKMRRQHDELTRWLGWDD
jgi:nitroreductase